MDTLISELRAVPVFLGLPDDELRSLALHVEVKLFAPGERILKFGEPGERFFVLLGGTAEAQRVYDDGGSVRLGALAPGDQFGEMSLLTGEPTSADIVAVEECRVAVWPQPFMSRFIARNSSVAIVLAKVLSSRLRSRQFDDDAQRRARQARRAQPDPYGLAATDGPRRVLVLNCGSSSLKYDLVDFAEPTRRLQGLVDRVGLGGARHSRIVDGKTVDEAADAPDHRAAIRAALAAVADAGTIEAVGHRVVHGGERYSSAAVVDDELIAEVRRLSQLAPLHNPANLAGIEACRELLPTVPQVAVFDTAFHQTMPQHAYVYAIPFEMYQQHGIRRYGFHGTSHHYVALQAATHLRRPLSGIKLVTCHLGNGASVCAVDHGRSIDTSMGLTPLEGLVMGTRSGDIDPALVIYLQRQIGLSVDQTDDLLNRKSGMLGLSGVSRDMREILAAADEGNRRAQLAIATYCYRVKKYVGAYVAALGGIDAVVFTGGVGENSRGIRARICQGLTYIGAVIDEQRNNAAVNIPRGEVVDIADERSPARILVVRTDEERMIARETSRALSRRDFTEVIRAREHEPIPLEVSAHHVHLQQEHVDILFGPGHELVKRAELSQPGQYACAESVDLKGPRGTVERVRVLGPTRPQTQVEISRTEEFKLGIDAPIRASGDLAGSPGLVLIGPKGSVRIEEGVICALRHIHMSPQDALTYGLRDRDSVLVRIEGERPLVFGEVLVRVHPSFRLAMHLDTDEANAAEINTGNRGFIEAVEERA